MDAKTRSKIARAVRASWKRRRLSKSMRISWARRKGLFPKELLPKPILPVEDETTKLGDQPALRENGKITSEGLFAVAATVLTTEQLREALSNAVSVHQLFNAVNGVEPENVRVTLGAWIKDRL
jgi:hypothetical protein